MTIEPTPSAWLGDSFGAAVQGVQGRHLPEATRRLAARVLLGEYGRRMGRATFGLSAAEAGAPAELRAAHAVMRIAQEAPLLVSAEERLAGTAPLLESAYHQMPVAGVAGTSHTTLGFERVLRDGLGSWRTRLAARRARGDLSAEQAVFLDALERCLDAMAVWHRRLLDELVAQAAGAAPADRQRLEAVRAALAPVPEKPPRTFREALQALWFLWEFQRLCGNWSGIGRMDKMLGSYLHHDLAEDVITLDEARDLLAHFWIKGCEWIGCRQDHGPSGGDAQFYQNVVLGGVDEAGRLVCNEVTFLILDIAEELHISDFPIAVRVGRQTPERLWRRLAEVQRLGGGIVSIYNDDLIINSLVEFGYPLEHARDFANDGCWEVTIPGMTAFSYLPFDLLQVFQNTLGLGPVDTVTPECDTFEDFYKRFHRKLRETLETIGAQGEAAFMQGPPSPLLSLLVEDCLESARPYHGRGARYTVRSPHAGGMPDTANSLYALKRLVFDERRFSLAELAGILRQDWAGHEDLRQSLRRDLVLYGNDDDAADAMLTRVFTDFVSICRERPRRNGVLMPPGISTFGRELAFRPQRTAQPFGAKAHEVLASNLAPTPGSDRRGPTAVIRSFCKQDFGKLTCGTPLDLKIHPGGLEDERGVEALVTLLKTFVAQGGFYLQVDVADAQVLREAQAHPERYPNLSVRISGWSARFVTLGREWQDMVIQRTEQRL
jgi:formate C-acetyltransferase